MKKIKNTMHYFFAKILFPHRKKYINIQDEILDDFIKKNKNTVFGKKYCFSNIKNIKDFQRNVPLHSYDDMQGYVEKMLLGEKNVLWGGDIPYFSKSSGTTAVSKYIPISRNALRKNHYMLGRDGFGYYLRARRDSKLLFGKGLIMGGRLGENPLIPGLENVGDVSAILQYNAPWYTGYFRKPSMEVSFMANFDEKIDAIIEETKNINITFLAGVPSWLTLFLQRLVEKTGKNNVLEIRPNLELFMRGGINIAPYKKQLALLMPGEQVWYWQNYNASEGFFAVQNEEGVDDMVLGVSHGIFYEFIPYAHINNPHFTPLLVGDLEVGKKYEIIITTDGGLRRYRIGDVVEVTNLTPLKIRVVGRTKSFLNAFGEELMQHTTDSAIKDLCEYYGIPSIEYVATAVVADAAGYHERYISSQEDIYSIVLGKQKQDSCIPSLQAVEDMLATYIDKNIQLKNSDYRAKRSGDLLMKQLVLHILPSNTFRDYLAKKGKIGGQHKIKRLRNSREDLMQEMGEIL